MNNYREGERLLEHYHNHDKKPCLVRRKQIDETSAWVVEEKMQGFAKA